MKDNDAETVKLDGTVSGGPPPMSRRELAQACKSFIYRDGISGDITLSGRRLLVRGVYITYYFPDGALQYNLDRWKEMSTNRLQMLYQDLKDVLESNYHIYKPNQSS